MSEIGIGLLLIVWLGLGGWGFFQLSDAADRHTTTALFWVCILLGPFMAGLAFARNRHPLTPKDTETE